MYKRGLCWIVKNNNIHKCQKAEKDQRLGLERLSILELLMELLYCASVTTSEKGIQLGNEYRQAVIEHKALTRCLVRK